MRTPTPAQVVLITGAAGGLGQGLVAEFAANNWRAAAACHSTLLQPGPENVWPLSLDVTKHRDASSVVEQILARWQRVDVLVCNAGITADNLVARMSDGEWDRVLAVNLKGAFNCAQAVLRSMVRQRDGHIINVASFSARTGQRGQANYAAAKAGLIGLTESLAKEVGSHNVRVNAVLPGLLPTAMTARLTEEQLAAFAEANALGRLNAVEEVARFIVFLATTANISGQAFQLDSRIARWT